MKYSSGKEIDALVRALIRDGWCFRRGSKHGRLYAPPGWPMLTVPSTPGERRAFLFPDRMCAVCAALPGLCLALEARPAVQCAALTVKVGAADS